jgi:hypothetical protein
LYCNFTVGSRHNAVACSSADKPLSTTYSKTAAFAGLSQQYLRETYLSPFPLSCSRRLRSHPRFVDSTVTVLARPPERPCP